MATVNFLYRSTKEKANLHLRLLYRFNETDFVFGANTKFEVLKDYWNKQHKKKSKDIDISNRQTEVNTELNKIENHVLNAFNSVNPDEINKEWLQTQIDYYYNPPQEAEQLPTGLLKYFDYFIEVLDVFYCGVIGAVPNASQPKFVIGNERMVNFYNVNIPFLELPHKKILGMF